MKIRKLLIYFLNEKEKYLCENYSEMYISLKDMNEKIA